MTARNCGWCRGPLEETQVRWCGKRCRQTAYRARQITTVEGMDGKPKKLAYADPPYPGLSRRYYRDEASYAGEVDHAELIARLVSDYDGWALSTSARALRDILPLCPVDARVCAWTKPIGAAPLTRGIHNAWEPVVVVPARSQRPGIRDHLSAQPARGGGTLPGRKPLAFCGWLFDLLGAAAGDAFDDLYPGTGVVGSSWAQLSPVAGVLDGRRCGTAATQGAGVSR